MPRLKIGKLILIAVFAAAAVSTGHAEKGGTIAETNEAAAAPPAALLTCPSAQGQMSSPIAATYKRFLGQTPLSYITKRNG